MIDLSCVFCSKEETNDHLFFSCEWTNKRLDRLKHWLNCRCVGNEVRKLLRWSKLSKFRKSVCGAALAALVYQIWRARNQLVWNAVETSEKEMFDIIRFGVKNRIVRFNCKKVKDIDVDWYDNL